MSAARSSFSFSPKNSRSLNKSRKADIESRLQEFAQETFGHTPRYKEIDSRGPDHDKYFVMVVQINGRPYGIGEGRSKQEASQQAAAMALHRLGVPLEGYTYDFSLAERYGLTLASG